jgi:hypothetical protein
MPDTAIQDDAIGEPLACGAEDLLALPPLSRAAIYAYLRPGEIPSRRLGKRYLIGKDMLVKWAAGAAS